MNYIDYNKKVEKIYKTLNDEVKRRKFDHTIEVN